MNMDQYKYSISTKMSSSKLMTDLLFYLKKSCFYFFLNKNNKKRNTLQFKFLDHGNVVVPP